MENINSFELAISTYLYKMQVTHDDLRRSQLVRDGYITDFQGEAGTKFTDKANAEFDDFYKSKNKKLMELLLKEGEAKYIVITKIMNAIQVSSEFQIEFLFTKMKEQGVINEFNYSSDEKEIRVTWS